MCRLSDPAPNESVERLERWFGRPLHEYPFGAVAWLLISMVRLALCRRHGMAGSNSAFRLNEIDVLKQILAPCVAGAPSVGAQAMRTLLGGGKPSARRDQLRPVSADT